MNRNSVMLFVKSIKVVHWEVWAIGFVSLVLSHKLRSI